MQVEPVITPSQAPRRLALPETNPLRGSELSMESDSLGFDAVWTELVSWFDQQREWIELVARIEAAE